MGRDKFRVQDLEASGVNDPLLVGKGGEPVMGNSLSDLGFGI